jgi:hypothetical protein
MAFAAGVHIGPYEMVANADRKRRFLVEAQAASRLNHPNIVMIHDISEENGVCFIAMEYVAGTTLEQANTAVLTADRTSLSYHAPCLPPNHQVRPRVAVFCSFFRTPSVSVRK